MGHWAKKQKPALTNYQSVKAPDLATYLNLMIAPAIVGNTQVGGKAAVAVASTRMVTAEATMQINRFKVKTRASPRSHTMQSISLLVHLNKCPRTQQWNTKCHIKDYYLN